MFNGHVTHYSLMGSNISTLKRESGNWQLFPCQLYFSVDKDRCLLFADLNQSNLARTRRVIRPKVSQKSPTCLHCNPASWSGSSQSWISNTRILKLAGRTPIGTPCIEWSQLSILISCRCSCSQLEVCVLWSIPCLLFGQKKVSTFWMGITCIIFGMCSKIRCDMCGAPCASCLNHMTSHCVKVIFASPGHWYQCLQALM